MSDRDNATDAKTNAPQAAPVNREPSPQFSYVPGANPYEKGLVADTPQKDKPKNGASDWW